MKQTHLIAFLLVVLVLAMPVSGASYYVIVNSSGHEGYLQHGTDGTWAQVRGGAGTAYSTAGDDIAEIDTTANAGEFDIMGRIPRGYDTSAIPDDATIDNVTLSIWPCSWQNALGNLNATVIKMAPTTLGGAAFVSGDYDSTDFTKLTDGQVLYSDMGYAQKDLTFNDAGKSAINKSGYTYLMIVSTNDANNTAPTWSGSKVSGFLVAATTGGWHSNLTIGYTEASGGGGTGIPNSTSAMVNYTRCTKTEIDWTNPALVDFNHVYTMWDNTFDVNLTNTTTSVIKTGLTAATTHTLSTKTCNAALACNATWVNHSITTATTCDNHPYLLFNNVNSTPGFVNNASEPWATWETDIISHADTGLTQTYTGAYGATDIGIKAGYTRDMALAWQITKDIRYFNRTRDSLTQFDQDGYVMAEDTATAVGAYSLAYDWIQADLDVKNDTLIRDRIANLTDHNYYNCTHVYNNVPSYIGYFDAQGQMYPMIGVAGSALKDYTNPRGLSLISNATEWKKVGYNYTYIGDTLHPGAERPMWEFGWDPTTGIPTVPTYRTYVIDQITTYLLTYNWTFGTNLVSTNPEIRNMALYDTRYSLPNQYSPDNNVEGQHGYKYQQGIMSLLTDYDKARALNHVNIIQSHITSGLLPRADFPTSYPLSNAVLYTNYGDYSGITPASPPNSSYIEPTGAYQMIRNGWSNKTDWLLLTTFNINSTSTRDTTHMDQLGFEYYSKGDILLADGGEPKSILLTIQRDSPTGWGGQAYGQYDVFHNTISIEDPRTPFTRSNWSNSTSAGPYKGDTASINMTANVVTTIQAPQMVVVRTKANITNVQVGNPAAKTALSSQINYERTVLSPNNDYFVVIDRMDGTQSWIYRNIFRPSSLNVNKTINNPGYDTTNVSTIGNVNGSLTIGTTAYNWLALPFNFETNTGITTNNITWNVTTPYNDNVTLKLFSSPASQIFVEKSLGRSGGYTYTSEVFAPVVWFRNATESKQSYRVTALLSNYSIESWKVPSELTVTGAGSAIKIVGGTVSDDIYTGLGVSQFDGYTTNGDTLFIRRTGNVTDYTAINVTNITDNGKELLNSTTRIAAAYNRTGGHVVLNITGTGATTIALNVTGTASNFKIDGVGAASSQTGDILTFTTALSEHGITYDEAEAEPTPPVADFTADTTSGTSPLSVSFTDTSTNTPTSWNWTFGGANYSAVQNPTHAFTGAGLYTVSLNATNADGSDIETKVNYITVSPPPDTTPPNSITGLTNTSISCSAATFSWTNPADADYGALMIWRNNTALTNLSNVTTSTSWAGLPEASNIIFSSKTCDLTGNCNATFTNKTHTTGYCGVPPVAAFSCTPTSFLAGNTTTCTDASTNTPTSWLWLFGDGNTSTSQNPTHQYDVAGAFDVRLQATNAYGSDWENKLMYIVVGVPPTPAPTATPVPPPTPTPVTPPANVTCVSSNNATVSMTGANGTCWFEWGLLQGDAMTWRTPNMTPVGGVCTYTIKGSPLFGNQVWYYRACDVSGCGADSTFCTLPVTPMPTFTYGAIFENLTASGFDITLIGFATVAPYVWVVPTFPGLIWGLLLTGLLIGWWLRGRDLVYVAIVGFIISVVFFGSAYGLGINLDPVLVGFGQGIFYAAIAGGILSIIKK